MVRRCLRVRRLAAIFRYSTYSSGLGREFHKSPDPAGWPGRLPTQRSPRAFAISETNLWITSAACDGFACSRKCGPSMSIARTSLPRLRISSPARFGTIPSFIARKSKIGTLMTLRQAVTSTRSSAPILARKTRLATLSRAAFNFPATAGSTLPGDTNLRAAITAMPATGRYGASQ